MSEKESAAGSPEKKRSRIIVELPVDVRRRARLLAAHHDLSLQEYMRRALERQIAADAAESLNAADEPVLASLWDNDADTVYDDLPVR